MEFSSTDCGYYKTEKNLQLGKHVNKTWLVAQNLNFRSKSRQIARDHTALVVNLIFPHNVIVGIFSTWKDPLHVSRVVDEPIPRLNDALKHLGLPRLRLAPALNVTLDVFNHPGITIFLPQSKARKGLLLSHPTYWCSLSCTDHDTAIVSKPSPISQTLSHGSLDHVGQLDDSQPCHDDPPPG